MALRLVVAEDISMCHDDVTDLLAEYETWLKSWGAAASTVTIRLSVLERALAETDGTTEGLAGWLSQYETAWTKSTYFSHLRSFYGWAYEAGRVDRDPTRGLRRPRAGTSKPRPLTEAEGSAVLEAATGRTAAYVRLGLLAGLRAHEVAKIAGQDVREDTIFVLGKGGQSALIPTHPRLWELAQEYPRRGFWFPSPSRPERPVTSSAVSVAVTKLFEQLGISGSAHRLRHTYGTRLLRGGAHIRTVQTLMRHASLAATAAYTAVDEVEQREAIERLAA